MRLIFGTWTRPLTVLATVAVLLSPTPVVKALVEPRTVSVASSASGRWQYPLNTARVVRHFDAPDPDWLPGHRGVDLAAINGEQIRSPALGVVSFAGVVVDRPVVTIDHGRIQTTYEPAEALVPVGRLVVAGEPFAHLAAGGHCEGCLHWGARISERYVNPLWLVQGYTPVLKTPR